MAYSDFTTLQKLTLELGIGHRRNKLFVKIDTVPASSRLTEDLEESQNFYSLTTEKAKSEFLITPVLREVRRNNPDKIGVFSGINLDLPEAGLSGFCDFILSSIPDSIELVAPIFCLVEAKNRTLEEGFAQCAAEMYAALLFNKHKQHETGFMYGCVTNGYEWCFLKLEDTTVQVDTDRYYLNNLPEILGIFQWIVGQ